MKGSSRRITMNLDRRATSAPPAHAAAGSSPPRRRRRRPRDGTRARRGTKSEATNSKKVISNGYEICDVDKQGRNDKKERGDKSASERVQLRRMLLDESLHGSKGGGDDDGGGRRGIERSRNGPEKRGRSRRGASVEEISRHGFKEQRNGTNKQKRSLSNSANSCSVGSHSSNDKSHAPADCGSHRGIKGVVAGPQGSHSIDKEPSDGSSSSSTTLDEKVIGIEDIEIDGCAKNHNLNQGDHQSLPGEGLHINGDINDLPQSNKSGDPAPIGNMGQNNKRVDSAPKGDRDLRNCKMKNDSITIKNVQFDESRRRSQSGRADVKNNVQKDNDDEKVSITVEDLKKFDQGRRRQNAASGDRPAKTGALKSHDYNAIAHLRLCKSNYNPISSKNARDDARHRSQDDNQRALMPNVAAVSNRHESLLKTGESDDGLEEKRPRKSIEGKKIYSNIDRQHETIGSSNDTKPQELKNSRSNDDSILSEDLQFDNARRHRSQNDQQLYSVSNTWVDGEGGDEGGNEDGNEDDYSVHFEDLQFDNARRHANRHASIPNMDCCDHDRPKELCNSRGDHSSAPSIMADYIALKLVVAELQSALQVAQSQLRKNASSIGKVGKLLDQNAALQTRNAELEEKNVFFLELLGNLERLGRLEGVMEKAMLDGIMAATNAAGSDDLDNARMKSAATSNAETLATDDLTNRKAEILVQKLPSPGNVDDETLPSSSSMRRSSSWKSFFGKMVANNPTTESMMSGTMASGGQRGKNREQQEQTQQWQQTRHQNRRHSTSNEQNWQVPQAATAFVGTIKKTRQPQKQQTHQQEQHPWQHRNRRHSSAGEQHWKEGLVETARRIPLLLSRTAKLPQDRNCTRHGEESLPQHLRPPQEDQSRWGDEIVGDERVPDYVKFDVDDVNDLRCSDLSMDFATYHKGGSLWKKRAKQRCHQQLEGEEDNNPGAEEIKIMSDIDEEQQHQPLETTNNRRQAATTTNKAMASLGAQHNSGAIVYDREDSDGNVAGGGVAISVQKSEAGSFSMWQSDGPLRYSATGSAVGSMAVAEDGGEGADRRRSLRSFVASEDEDEHDWTPSVFAFSETTASPSG